MESLKSGLPLGRPYRAGLVPQARDGLASFGSLVKRCIKPYDNDDEDEDDEDEDEEVYENDDEEDDCCRTAANCRGILCALMPAVSAIVSKEPVQMPV